MDWVRDAHAADIARGRLVVYTYADANVFHMAHAKNLAHRCGIREGADILVNIDADNFTGRGFIEHVRELMADENVFLWSRMIPHVLPRGISGRIAVSARAFVNIGGYDEKFDVWGHDDKDFNQRLQRIGYEAREIDPAYLNAVRHNDKMRFREYPHAAKTNYEDEVVIQQSNGTIANFGAFGIGTVTRNFDAQPVELGRMPTRIFGVGMHKTGTTSLHAALNILGFDCVHWKSARWAKAICEQIRATGRSATLERHYAVTDYPVPLFYRELDRAYSGSKFILTVRNELQWLDSVRRHWSYEHNRYRAQWDTDYFTHRLHTEIYGQRQFDADLFLTKYRAHNAAVTRHFDGRSDFMVLDIDAGGCWQKLCAFLDRPVPPVQYPIENACGG